MELIRISYVLLSSLSICFGNPVSQPTVYSSQYNSAQALPNQQYRQSYVQPQYLQEQRARPVYEGGSRSSGLQQYSRESQQQEPIQQVLLSSNVDRQVQRVAQLAGPLFLQHVQTAQQQGQAQDVIATAQRKATSQTLGRQIQPLPVPVPVAQQAPQQYTRDITELKYSRPLVPAATYKQVQQTSRYSGYKPQPVTKEELEEDYDHNPSYQFGFDVKDDLNTNYQNRKEQRDGNKITGSYSVVDSDGFIRTVTYTADPKEGFKAEVSRQPTDIVVKIPKQQDPQLTRNQQHYQAQQVSRAQSHRQPQNPNLVYQYQ